MYFILIEVTCFNRPEDVKYTIFTLIIVYKYNTTGLYIYLN